MTCLFERNENAVDDRRERILKQLCIGRQSSTGLPHCSLVKRNERFHGERLGATLIFWRWREETEVSYFTFGETEVVFLFRITSFSLLSINNAS